MPNLSASQRPAKIARGAEDAVERVAAGDRELPALSITDDSVRRFIALVDECYDRRVPLYIEAAVPLAALYPEGHLTFPFRRALSRLHEMQLQRFTHRESPPRPNSPEERAIPASPHSNPERTGSISTVPTTASRVYVGKKRVTRSQDRE